MSELQTTRSYSPWPHRAAMVLMVTTFPLIWVGGLVTTYDAGMAVPDWPATYGYNLFLYPWQTWIAGPWDLFIEHGHRLLGAIVGLLAILVLVTTIRSDRRRWMSVVAVGLLALVIVQGVLGGQRVLRDDRRIAQLHGCIGPLFFALTVAFAAFTSRRWFQNGTSSTSSPSDGRSGSRATLFAGSIVTLGLAVAQLLLGSQLRHGIEYSTPRVFQLSVTFHILVASLLLIQSLWMAIQLFRAPTHWKLRSIGFALAALLATQFLLGIGTWAMKYGWPAILQPTFPAPAFTVQAESMAQSLIVTAHVAVGSLILGLGSWLVARSGRIWFLERNVKMSPPEGATFASFTEVTA